MKQNQFSVLFSFLVFVVILWIPSVGITGKEQTECHSFKNFFSMTLKANEVGFMFFGPCSNVIVRIADKTILFDPSCLCKSVLEILNKEGIDLIICTHSHWEHFSKQTVLELFKGSQPHIAIDPNMVLELKKDIPREKLITPAPGRIFNVENIVIDALEGMHIGSEMLFRITINGIKIFHGGDSAYVPLQTMVSNLAFVPTGNPSPTCNPEYAYQMIHDMKPQIAVPMNGNDIQHVTFMKLIEKNLPGVKVIIPERYTSQKVLIQK